MALAEAATASAQAITVAPGALKSQIEERSVDYRKTKREDKKVRDSETEYSPMWTWCGKKQRNHKRWQKCSYIWCWYSII